MKIGQEAIDKITGFKGIITGKVEYISGCKQYILAPKVKENGEFVDSHWFDEDRLEVTGAKEISLKSQTPGPDKAAPCK